MSNLLAFLIIAVAYYIGEFIGTKTKASVPSTFVIACLFLLGFWTFFPNDIVALAGMAPPLGGVIVIMLLITHMGTITSIRQLCLQWKIIVITLAGLAGMCAFCWIIGIPFIGRDYVICGLPPLTGGLVAANMMQTAALEKGLVTASVLAITVICLQGFFGYPITAWCLKREGRRLLNDYRDGKLLKIEASDGTVKKKRLIPATPDRYVTPALIFAKLMAVAYLSSVLSGLTGGAVNQAVITLILGIVFTELGFLEENSLTRAGANGFLMFVLMVYVFDGLKLATPEMLAECIVPVVSLIIIGIIGMAILAVPVGKALHVSWEMAFATSLTALYGFPANFILTQEASKALTDNDVEQKYLTDVMSPQMIVGGFVTTTIASVLIAGVFVNFL